MTSSGTRCATLLAASLLFLFLSKGYAQQEATVWYFGFGSGMDFSSGLPVPISNPSFDAYEGCATFCDPNGGLLFYTNGGGSRPGLLPNGPRKGYIWNRNHEVMYDMGDSEGGGYSAAQNSVIVPVPGSNHEYYLFTMDQQPSTVDPATQRGLSYFIVDMNLNGGLGGVSLANQLIYKDATESMAITLQENGEDYWIVIIEQSSKNFVVFPVTAQGIQAPVIQPRNAASAIPLVLKFSPDGNFLCIGRELYLFDKATGAITLWTLLPAANDYTYSFSPNSRYLYQLSDGFGSLLVRYDVTSAHIPSSFEIIADVGFIFPGYLQIGPDGNLYMNDIGAGQSVNSTTAVSILHCPDSENPSFERVAFEYPAEPGIGITIGLTNFPDFIFRSFSGIDAKMDTVYYCEDGGSTLQPAFSGNSYLWSTGEVTESISVSTSGAYSVTIRDDCASRTQSFFAIRSPMPEVVLVPGFSNTPCYGDSVSLNAFGANTTSLLWSNGETGPRIRAAAGSEITVTATNSCGESSQNIAIPAENCCAIYLPNAFSPNDDGINDQFRTFPNACIFKNYNLKLFSRWGELVFETEDVASTWNGTFRGKPMPEGTYLYQLNYTLQKPEGVYQETIAGNLTLIR